MKILSTKRQIKMKRTSVDRLVLGPSELLTANNDFLKANLNQVPQKKNYFNTLLYLHKNIFVLTDY